MSQFMEVIEWLDQREDMAGRVTCVLTQTSFSLYFIIVHLLAAVQNAFPATSPLLQPNTHHSHTTHSE